VLEVKTCFCFLHVHGIEITCILDGNDSESNVKETLE
jgi:hypothetical protein